MYYESVWTFEKIPGLFTVFRISGAAVGSRETPAGRIFLLVTNNSCCIRHQGCQISVYLLILCSFSLCSQLHLLKKYRPGADCTLVVCELLVWAALGWCVCGLV